MNDLYENVARLCREKGISVSALCELAKVSPGILSDLKTGRKKSISSDTLAKLAAALGTSADLLLGREATPDPGDELIAYYGRVSKELTESDRQEIMALMRIKAEMKRRDDKN